MDSIKVAIKVRPLTKREREENLPIRWAVQNNSIAPLEPELKKRGEPFYFDHIFDMRQTNYDVFNIVAKPIVDAAINGMNGTIFAYGQTSSGKTFTMMGEGEKPGVIPLAVDYIFDQVTNNYDREFLLSVSCIEIYNEKINDLLDKNGVDLKIKEEKNGQVIVTCKEEVANCSEMVLAIMRKGLKNRRIGETNMNEKSSRSHTIFRITIESRESDSDGAVQISQLNLVDLAGCERSKQSGTTGDRFNEARHVNMSLSALGLVIMQLSEAQDNPQRYINFRDSKLTRILQTSLGGNAMTTIICTVTLAAFEETQCTLAFASRAKQIKNKPQVNECVSDAALLKRYVKQLAKLRAELEKSHAASLAEMESKLMEKESKLMEKDRAYQLLEERIELLTTRIVSGNNASDDDRLKRRPTRAEPSTHQPKPKQFRMVGGLPSIEESKKTPEKKLNKEHSKQRQSIIETLDLNNETFQIEFTDFELKLIESERSRAYLFNGSSGGDDGSSRGEFLGIGRRRHRVRFNGGLHILYEKPRSSETTPENNSSKSSSPGIPQGILKTGMNFLTERNNAPTNDHPSLEEVEHFDKQMRVEEAFEAATIEHDETVVKLQGALTEREKTRQEILDQFVKHQKSETDFNAPEIDFEKSPDSLENSAPNLNTSRKRFIDARELELGSELLLSEKRYKEKLKELTSGLECRKTRNIDASNNSDALEANERKSMNIIDMRTNERIKRELNEMSDSYEQSSRENPKNMEQNDEITCPLRSKRYELSEYETKLMTIMPESEKLKDRANERKLRLEKYKSEIECLTTESEKNISALKVPSDSVEIKSAVYRKQLAESTNRNATLEMKLVELPERCKEPKIINEKSAKTMRNDTSKIRPEEEMEDMPYRNRIIERNLDYGAGNPVEEFQDIGIRSMKDPTDMRVQYKITVNEYEELKNALSSERSRAADTIELMKNYETLLEEKNRVDTELVDKRSRLVQLEKMNEDSERKNEELRLRNAELDAEMDDITLRIQELTNENSELDEKLYKIENSVASREAKSNELIALNRELATRVGNYSEEIELLKSQRDELRSENEKMAETSKSLTNENFKLREKLSDRDCGDSLSCGGYGERSTRSPAIEVIRIGNKRRRSPDELFNFNRPLEVFKANDDDSNECRCDALQQHCSSLEKDLAFKNAKLDTFHLKMQSKIFPYMRKCQDLEEILASLMKKIELLKAEIRELQETRAKEKSSECERCRQWRMNRCDQASQSMPERTPIYMSGMHSGIMDITAQKLEKDKTMLKNLCQSRQKRIFELEDRLKELEKCSSTEDSLKDEMPKDPSAYATSSRSDATTSTSEQAMKENIPIVWTNRKQRSRLNATG